MIKKNLLSMVLLSFLITQLIGCNDVSTLPTSQINTSDDIQYAQLLWQQMTAKKLVGVDAIKIKPFFGGAAPHGTILEVSSQNITVHQHTGFLVVKKNYSGEGVSVTAVEADRRKFLTSITVMYQRESGYDPADQNWFWVKYRPDGRLFEKDFQNKSLFLAGKLIKTKDNRTFGCIYCHSSAGDSDYIFYPEIKNPAFNYLSSVK